MNRYRVIAPDYPGYTQFSYTLENLTNIVEKLTEKVGADRDGVFRRKKKVGKGWLVGDKRLSGPIVERLERLEPVE